jgi:hypothetical protein
VFSHLSKLRDCCAHGHVVACESDIGADELSAFPVVTRTARSTVSATQCVRVENHRCNSLSLTRVIVEHSQATNSAMYMFGVRASLRSLAEI